MKPIGVRKVVGTHYKVDMYAHAWGKQQAGCYAALGKDPTFPAVSFQTVCAVGYCLPCSNLLSLQGTHCCLSDYSEHPSLSNYFWE